MLVGKGSMVLLGAGLLLVGEPEAGLLPTLSVSSAAQPGLRTGQVFRDRLKNGTDAPEMIVIPAGRFRMGDIQGKGTKDEQPVHEVHISRRFGMSRYEITFDQYDEFAKATGRQIPDDEGFGRGRRPVIRVSWNEAGRLCRVVIPTNRQALPAADRGRVGICRARAEPRRSIGGATR